MEIAIAGAGNVGLITGVCLAELGYNITFVDTNEEKVKLLNSNILPIFEPELENLINKNTNKLSFTTNYKEAYKKADIIFIAVDTPEGFDGNVNLEYIYEVAKQIAESIEKDCIIVNKSTVPVGTNEKIEEIIKQNLKKTVNIHIASNPEFLSMGTAVNDGLNPSRIILGVQDKYTENILKEIYKNYNAPMLVTDIKSAEMIKYASNNFLALKISYINEISNLCECVGANIQDVAKGMGYDDRIGDKFLNAGIGYGGSCFVKDTKALYMNAKHNNYELKTIKATIEVNEEQKIKLIKKSRKYYSSLKGLTVAVLGVTFKPETDSIKDAPSIKNIELIIEEGANIKLWDLKGAENLKKKKLSNITYCSTIEDAITESDICFIFTEWRQIKEFDLNKYKNLMRTPIVLDGRNCYDLKEVEKIGLIYDSIGRKTIK